MGVNNIGLASGVALSGPSRCLAFMELIDKNRSVNFLAGRIAYWGINVSSS